jgi:hypothetical protein
MSKLAEPWWDWGLNPITGLTPPEGAYQGKNISEERRYAEAYPKLDIKTEL